VVDAPNSRNYIVWNAFSMEILRVFPAEQTDVWGTFRWSSDSKYIAKCGNGLISIYEFPTMQMTKDASGKRTSIRVNNIQKFIWYERENLLVCACYPGNLRTNDDNTTRIVIIDIITRKEYKWKTISWELADCDLVSSETEQWICAILKKSQKKKVISTVI